MEMTNDRVQLFEDQPIRTAWIEDEEEWYFSGVDVVGVLTEQPDIDGARNYWKVLKNRLKEEGSQLVTNCNQLKMKSPKDGKRYNTDVANTEQLLRLIQSIPSKKAEPFKMRRNFRIWLRGSLKPLVIISMNKTRNEKLEMPCNEMKISHPNARIRDGIFHGVVKGNIL